MPNRTIVFSLTVLTAPLPLLIWTATSFKPSAPIFVSFNMASFAWLLMLLVAVKCYAPKKKMRLCLVPVAILGLWPLLVVEVWPSLVDLWFYLGVRLGHFAS
jgi:hypothetical protein